MAGMQERPQRSYGDRSYGDRPQRPSYNREGGHRMIGVTVTVHGNRVAVRIFRLRQIVKRLSQ